MPRRPLRRNDFRGTLRFPGHSRPLLRLAKGKFVCHSSGSTCRHRPQGIDEPPTPLPDRLLVNNVAHNKAASALTSFPIRYPRHDGMIIRIRRSSRVGASLHGRHLLGDDFCHTAVPPQHAFELPLALEPRSRKLQFPVRSFSIFPLVFAARPAFEPKRKIFHTNPHVERFHRRFELRRILEHQSRPSPMDEAAHRCPISTAPVVGSRRFLRSDVNL